MSKQKRKCNLTKNQTIRYKEIEQLIVRREQIRAEYEKFIKEQNSENENNNEDQQESLQKLANAFWEHPYRHWNFKPNRQ